MVNYTEKQIDDLIDSMDMLLYDMGVDRRSVCLYSKAKARIAFEPFMDKEFEDYYISLTEAESIIAETEK